MTQRGERASVAPATEPPSFALGVLLAHPLGAIGLAAALVLVPRASQHAPGLVEPYPYAWLERWGRELALALVVIGPTIAASAFLAFTRWRPRRLAGWGAWCAGLALPPLVWGGLGLVWIADEFGSGARSTALARAAAGSEPSAAASFAAALELHKRRVESAHFLGRGRAELEHEFGPLDPAPPSLGAQRFGRRALEEPQPLYDSDHTYSRWWLFRFDAAGSCTEALWARIRQRDKESTLEHAYALR